MEEVVLVNCALAALRAGGWGPWACAHGIQDAAPPELNLITTLPYVPTLILFSSVSPRVYVVQSVF